MLPKFVLCRSDLGDGGWSLHEPDATDEDIAEGDDTALVTGTAEWDEDAQQWDRPNMDDYQKAARILKRRQS